jgi:hypothetical protein
MSGMGITFLEAFRRKKLRFFNPAQCRKRRLSVCGLTAIPAFLLHYSQISVVFNVEGWESFQNHTVWPKKVHFPLYFADFFDRSAATAYKNPLRLSKNGHFFVSDATT